MVTGPVDDHTCGEPWRDPAEPCPCWLPHGHSGRARMQPGLHMVTRSPGPSHGRCCKSAARPAPGSPPGCGNWPRRAGPPWTTGSSTAAGAQPAGHHHRPGLAGLVHRPRLRRAARRAGRSRSSRAGPSPGSRSSPSRCWTPASWNATAGQTPTQGRRHPPVDRPVVPAVGVGPHWGMSGTLLDQGRRGAWNALRARVLARDGNRCVMCGSTDRLQVDHIVERDDGGTDASTTCRRCASRTTRRSRRPRRRARKTTVTQRDRFYASDGNPAPPSSTRSGRTLTGQEDPGEPRYFPDPHPDRAGSMVDAVAAHAREEMGIEFLPWQDRVLDRLLEHDARGPVVLAPRHRAGAPPVRQVDHRARAVGVPGRRRGDGADHQRETDHDPRPDARLPDALPGPGRVHGADAARPARDRMAGRGREGAPVDLAGLQPDARARLHRRPRDPRRGAGRAAGGVGVAAALDAGGPQPAGDRVRHRRPRASPSC